MLILLAAFALQQRKCIVRLSPSPSRSPFCILFFGSSSATDHKRKVLKSLLSVNQIKVKVMQLLYIIYNVPLSLSFSVSLLLLLSLILPISIFLCLSLCTPSLSLSLSLASLPFLLLSISVQLPPRSLVMHIINGPHKLSCSLPEKNSRVSRKFVQITITKLVYTNLLVLYCNNTNNTKLLDFFTYLTCTKLKSNFKYSVKEIIY